ncbi:MAG TPA: hypothetical protein VKQ54_05720 [Caulobacteraceae bacterium]|nr:hypothetical protein [Caulobacteraceae bacterium]
MTSRSTGDGAKHLGTDDARQASRTGYMWRVLALSLVFASLVVLGAWIWNSAANPRQPPGERGQEHVVAQPDLVPPPATAPANAVVRPTSRDTGA